MVPLIVSPTSAWHLDDHGCAAPRACLDDNTSFQRCSAVTHRTQAKAACSGRGSAGGARPVADPIVLNAKPYPFVSRQHEIDAPGPGVLGHVIERLLGDAKKRFLGVCRLGDIAAGVELDLQAVALEAGRVTLERGNQPVPAQARKLAVARRRLCSVGSAGRRLQFHQQRAHFSQRGRAQLQQAIDSMLTLGAIALPGRSDRLGDQRHAE